MNRFNSNKFEPITQPLYLHNYYGPFTNQVEALKPLNESKETDLCVILHIPSPIPKVKPPRPPNRKLYFTQPDGNTNKYSIEWWRNPRSQSREKKTVPTLPTNFYKWYWESANLKLAKRKRMQQEAKLVFDSKIAALTESQINQGVISFIIVSAAWDTVFTFDARKVWDLYIQTNHVFTNFFPCQTVTTPQPLKLKNPTSLSLRTHEQWI